MFYTSSFIGGFGSSSGLIMAIGAQNAHVIKTGLLRRHVGLTVLACILIDVLLISAGVAGMGELIQTSPLLLNLAKWGGAAFLLWYGVRSWRAVFAQQQMDVSRAPVQSARQALFAVIALSLLNPHVYLDTVVLLGAIGSHAAPAARPSFVLGAVCASTLWFCSIGFGAHRLAPLFARPLAWKWIDGITGSTMLAMSCSLALG